MTEDDQVRKWFPDAHAETRIRRLKYDRGQYLYCRHHKALKDRRFYCDKRRAERTNCDGCRTCPNCDGTLGLHAREFSHERHRVYITEQYTCVHCGAFLNRKTFVEKDHTTSRNTENKCDVHRCNNTAYEGHKHEADGKSWTICVVHQRRMKTWRQNKNKGEDQKPLIVDNGKLIENAAYRKKQERRKCQN